MKQYYELRKISIGQGDDYTTGCLLDFGYFKKNYSLIAKRQLRERMVFLFLPHPLTNFETKNYYQNEPRLNGVYSRNNLPKKQRMGHT